MASSTGWTSVGKVTEDASLDSAEEFPVYDHVSIVERRNRVIREILDAQSDENEALPEKLVKRQVSGYMKKRVACEQDWKCAVCRAKLDLGFEVDHRLALRKGGTNDRDNLWALCSECHKLKTARENERRFQRKRARELRKHRLVTNAVEQHRRMRKPDWRYCVMCGECGVVYSSFFEHVCAVQMVRHEKRRMAKLRRKVKGRVSTGFSSFDSALKESPAGEWMAPNPF